MWVSFKDAIILLYNDNPKNTLLIVIIIKELIFDFPIRLDRRLLVWRVTIRRCWRTRSGGGKSRLRKGEKKETRLRNRLQFFSAAAAVTAKGAERETSTPTKDTQCAG